ncbi:DUF4393 domain-containing protein [Shimia aestuarii]|uniref:DUF4393 domain-containing protein n=1 Tax=Shimia aestuarii TaxID=254406 RepID=UPI001FB2CB80|nr:DUF4393 domain-containing protein [Shimia aestuarii]
MSADEEKPGKVSDALNAAANLAKAVPIYDDALKPIATETGKALGTVGKVVNVALAPVRGLVWSAEFVEKWVEQSVSQKLEGVPEEEIRTPDLAIAGPTIEALKFYGQNPELSEMFANLLASSMQTAKAKITHPSFVEKVKAMSSLDAQVFAYLANEKAASTITVQDVYKDNGGRSDLYQFCNPDLLLLAHQAGFRGKDVYLAVQASIETLSGLGLVHPRADATLTSPEKVKDYNSFEESDWFKAFTELPKKESRAIELKRNCILTTEVGNRFAESVLAK